MKKFKKSTAIVFSVIVCVLIVVGFVLSYIPMTFGANTFVSFSGTLNISSDITGGMYGEYNITSENPSDADILNSMTSIKEVFDENGYKNVNVYCVGKTKIRVEVSYPSGDTTFAKTYQLLSNVGSGAFSLRNEYTLSEKSIVVDGAECVDKITVFTNNSTKYLSIHFNKQGQEDYKALCEKTTTIYLALGDYAQSISASNVTDYTQFTLSDDDYDNLIALEQRIKLGCLKVDLDSSTKVINTMSASLSAGESSGNPFVGSFTSSTAYVVIVAAIFIIMVMGLSIFAIKFGLYSVLLLVTILFNSYLFLILMCLMPSIEFGLSAAIALVIGITVIYTYAYIFVNRVKQEYESGKSLGAALETSYKKNLPINLIGNISLFLTSLVMFAFSFGELTSVFIVFAICSFLSILTNLFIIPFLIKICISFKGLGTKLFMLKKRDMFADVVVNESDITVSKEGE